MMTTCASVEHFVQVFETNLSGTSVNVALTQLVSDFVSLSAEHQTVIKTLVTSLAEHDNAEPCYD